MEKQKKEIVTWTLSQIGEVGISGAAADIKAQEVISLRNGIYRKKCKNLKPIEGSLELIAKLKEKYGAENIAVVTNARSWEVSPFLSDYADNLGLVITSDYRQNCRVKPDPSIINICRHELNCNGKITPLAIESNALGVQAAKNAKLFTVVVSNDKNEIYQNLILL